VVKQSADTSVASLGVLAQASTTDTFISIGYGSVSDTCRVYSSYISTGAFKPLTFWTSDAERMRIDSSGNVGIGTSSPLSRLVVSNAGAAGLEFFTNAPGGGVGTYIQSYNRSGAAYVDAYYYAASHTWRTTASVTSMVLDSSGNVGIGTSSPTSKFHVTGSGSLSAEIRATATSSATDSRAVMRLVSTASTFGGGLIMTSATDSAYQGSSLSLYNFDNQPLVFGTNNTERARIDSSGNVLVGTTTILPVNLLSGKLQVLQTGTTGHAACFKTNSTSGFAAAAFSRNGNNGAVCEFGYDTSTTVGSISVTSVATVYNTTSDYRLKNVVGAVSDSGSRIDALEPVEYTWKSNGLRTRGFLAHKFQEVYSQSVTGTKDEIDADGNPVYQAMQAGSTEVIADLIAEIQSLRKRLTALEST
jgi:hypothetical protein